ncbi:hypothetical protein CTR2_R31730 [Comamonas thiooxydans]|uniref:hypothetical protein n=1 Tax=Comamonas thiooxydans TaxID=363952 RepID=UPI0015951174|nr:hypothetical protein [Comamonas thiooxydans]BDR09835.1 hypothetical protein CTR2_R31730 [Comamonas thiooxydans]
MPDLSLKLLQQLRLFFAIETQLLTLAVMYMQGRPCISHKQGIPNARMASGFDCNLHHAFLLKKLCHLFKTRAVWHCVHFAQQDSCNDYIHQIQLAGGSQQSPCRQAVNDQPMSFTHWLLGVFAQITEQGVQGNGSQLFDLFRLQIGPKTQKRSRLQQATFLLTVGHEKGSRALLSRNHGIAYFAMLSTFAQQVQCALQGRILQRLRLYKRHSGLAGLMRQPLRPNALAVTSPHQGDISGRHQYVQMLQPGDDGIH